MERMSIVEFCEEFDQLDGEVTVLYMMFNKSENFTIQTKCQKQSIEFWAGANDKGIRFFVEGADITSNGIFCEAVKCIKQVNDASVDYDIYDKSGKVLFLVSILGY